MLSKHFDDSVAIMARITLARIALTKLQKAIFGTRRVALESQKITYESLVLSLLLYGSECWCPSHGVSAENMRLLQRFHRKCFQVRIMCRATRHHTRKHHISTEELEPGGEAASGHPRHQALCSFDSEGADSEILVPRARFSYGRTGRPDSISPASLSAALLGGGLRSDSDGKQPSGKTKVLYDSAVQKLLDEVGLSFLDAANKSEWHQSQVEHNQTRGARCSGSRGIRVFSPSCRQTVTAPGPLLSPKGLPVHHPHHWHRDEQLPVAPPSR
jgi:hypothetical protein